ncbi:MAG: hypothetical protein IJQ34_00680 [Kiritimatiellae bacterium]|nr:hypothetical protein [Kiritimatiellia bacterium]
MNEIEKNSEYFAWIGELKKRYRSTQIKAAISVNSTLLEFYWSLGKDICERYSASKLGNQFYKILSADLKKDIPHARGLSPSSLKYSGYFYKLYSKLLIGQQVADQHLEPSQQAADLDNLPKCVNPSVSIRQTLALPISDLLVRVPWGHHMLITSISAAGMSPRRSSMSARLWKTVGVAMSWRWKLQGTCIPGRVKQSPTSL